MLPLMTTMMPSIFSKIKETWIAQGICHSSKSSATHSGTQGEPIYLASAMLSVTRKIRLHPSLGYTILDVFLH